MNKKLYVGNLPYSITEAELRDAFGPHGAVESVRIITDKLSGRSKGFAFVEMGTDDEAQKALGEMNGKEIGGRKLIVSEARPEPPRSSGGARSFSNGRGGGGGFGDRPPPREDRGRRFRDQGNGARDSRDRRNSSSDDDDDNFGNR